MNRIDALAILREGAEAYNNGFGINGSRLPAGMTAFDAWARGYRSEDPEQVDYVARFLRYAEVRNGNSSTRIFGALKDDHELVRILDEEVPVN